MHPPKHDPAKPHCFLTHCSVNLEASRTNDTIQLVTGFSLQVPGLPQELARAQWNKEIPAVQILS
jgi:hypothetical protein